MPLSQLHYHFGSKGGLIIALFTEDNNRLLERQTEMYAQDKPLWQRYEQACDFLEDDLDSGYVRVLPGDAGRRLVQPRDRRRGPRPAHPLVRAPGRRGPRG